MRDELLNGEIFCSLHEAQIIIERWRTFYTTKGLHAPSSRWTKDQIQSDYLQMPIHWLTAPSGACQHPALLWYDTVDNQTVLQSDSEHLSCCSCLRHVLIGALVRKWTSVWGHHINQWLSRLQTWPLKDWGNVWGNIIKKIGPQTSTQDLSDYPLKSFVISKALPFFSHLYLNRKLTCRCPSGFDNFIACLVKALPRA